VIARLDDPSRATLALVARLLYDVDPCRPAALAGEKTRLLGLRLKMPGSAQNVLETDAPV
jgi:hypothetical protein